MPLSYGLGRKLGWGRGGGGGLPSTYVENFACWPHGLHEKETTCALPWKQSMRGEERRLPGVTVAVSCFRHILPAAGGGGHHRGHRRQRRYSTLQCSTQYTSM